MFLIKTKTQQRIPPSSSVDEKEKVAVSAGDARGKKFIRGGLRVELAAASLTLDGGETTERKIERLITENPVIVFGRTSCCMCHVMKNLLSTLGVHPAVIELEETELGALAAHDSQSDCVGGSVAPPPTPTTSPAPAVFIGGRRLGGLESLMGLHLSGHLVPLLRDVGALQI